MITLCGTVPYSLYIIGAAKTGNVNAALLLLAEIIFTVIFTPFIGEKTSAQKIIGASVVLVGAAVIMYHPGTPVISHFGDVLVILSTLLYPVNNFYGKKALNFLSPSIIIFGRLFLGGIFLSLLALVVEPAAIWFSVFSLNWPIILSYGLIILFISRIMWYKGLKHLDISKAVLLGMTFPAFSILILLYLGQQISGREWLGFLVLMIGTMVTVFRPSVNQAHTKYALEPEPEP